MQINDTGKLMRHDSVKQGSATYGPRAGSGPQPVYQIVVTVYGQSSGIIFHESVLLPHCAMNVLYVAFWAFITNCENQLLI